MALETLTGREESIKAARRVSLDMRAALASRPNAGSAEVPMSTFLRIMGLLERLADHLDQSPPPQAGTAAACHGIDRQELIAAMSAVPTMGGGKLSELMAPAEIAEIADAVIAVLPPLSATDHPGVTADLLARFFREY